MLSVPQRPILHESIVALMRERGNRLLRVSEIHERLRDPDATPELVERAVEELENDGAIIAVRGKRYSLLEFTPYHAGRIKVHPDGHGTLLAGEEDHDVYIDRKHVKGAMNGDLVIVRIDKHRPTFR